MSLIYKNITSLSWSFYSDFGSPQNNREERFECKTCNRRYSSIKSLRQHTKIHEESNPHKCIICMKVFTYKSALERHYTKHTKPHIFSTCGEKFARKSYLIKHQAAHSVKETYKCPVCQSERFSTQKGLCKVTFMICHYESKYLCGICDKKYHNLSCLKRHEKTHS